MKQWKWIKQNPLVSFVIAMFIAFGLLFASQSWGSDDDSLAPLDQPMTSEMVYVDSHNTVEKEVIIVDKETGEETGHGVIRWFVNTGKVISEKSHDLYEKWTGEPNPDEISVDLEPKPSEPDQGNDEPTKLEL